MQKEYRTRLIEAVEKYNAAQASESTRIDPYEIFDNMNGCSDEDFEKAIAELEKGAE